MLTETDLRTGTTVACRRIHAPNPVQTVTIPQRLPSWFCAMINQMPKETILLISNDAELRTWLSARVLHVTV